MKYDLLLQHGEVVDPGSKLRGKMDVGILGGTVRDPVTGIAFPGGIIPSSRFDPYAAAILALVPLPNQPGVNNFFRQADLLDNSDRILGRLDYKFSSKDSLFGRYIYSNRDRQIPGAFGGVLDEILGKRPIDRLVGAQHVVINLHPPRLFAKVGAEAVEVLQVLPAQPLRIDQQLVIADFQVAELRPLLEWEFDLFRGQKVEENHLVALEAEVAQGTQEQIDLVEAVRQDNDHTAALHLRGHLVPQRGHARLAAGLRLLQGVEQEGRGLLAGRGATGRHRPARWPPRRAASFRPPSRAPATPGGRCTPFRPKSRGP